MLAEQDGLTIEQAENRQVRVTLKGDDGTEASIVINASALSYFAAALLKAGIIEHRRSGTELIDATETAIPVANIVPTTLALGPSHLADHVSLTLRFGDAALGVAIPNRQSRGLGQALVAHSVGSAAH